MVDKSCILQIFGSLMKRPQLLTETEKYSLTPLDFNSRFQKYIYMALSGLYADGATRINPIDVENYLESNESAKIVFKQEDGIQYLQDAEELSEVENFPYYYKKLKKLNLLRDLKGNGIDTSSFYIENLTDPKALEVNGKFESLSIEDILEGVKRKLLNIEHDYLKNDVTETETASHNIRDLVERLEEEPDVGFPIQGEIFNEVMRGARLGTLCIRSGGSGVSKTRQAVGDACYLAYPFRYDEQTCQWINCGGMNKTLFIATEQSFKEIRTMILSYLTGFNESKFSYARFTDGEKKIIAQAIWVMENYDNLFIVRMPNPSIALVKSLVRENWMLHEITHVFYDYIFIGPSLLNEFKGVSLRNDEVLLMFATALKDLAVELNVFVMTSTQVNANSDDNSKIRNEATLAGGRSTINKADIGAVMARVTPQELETLKEYCDKYGEPNIVTDIYKVRSGQYNQVRIWSDVNLGNLRKKDLFITTSRLEIVEQFTEESRFFWEVTEASEEIKVQLDYLNRLTDF